MKKESLLSDSNQVVAHPGPRSIEDLLRFVDPGPDDEAERFVAAIYKDRRGRVGS